MGRGKRALAAAAILAALAAASIAAAPRAAAEGGELAGELPVAGGVALVSWSGGPAGALAEAARSRGCNVRSVYANAPGGGFVGYVPGANVAAANRAFLAAYPAGLPASPVLVVCGEPSPPRIVFLGDVAGERRAAIRDEVASVARFYAERFGVAVGESTLYVSPDREAVAAVHLELTGREYPLSADEEGGAATYTSQDGALGFINGWFVNDHPHQFASVLAHEYYHMIQYDILRGRRLHAAPEWLIEGTASYGELLYLEAHWDVNAEDELTFVSLNDATPFEEVSDSFRRQYYGLAAQAVGWLVDGTGNPRAHLEFWLSLTREPDWRAAFVSAFGITVDGFLESFGQYRIDVRASFPSISGVVTDLDGNRLSGVRVIASGERFGASSTTGVDGSFAMRVVEGEYILYLSSRFELPDVGIYSLGYNPQVGYANVCGYDPLIMVGETGVANIFMAILPELLERSDPPLCNEGRPGFHLISGFIRDHEGNLIEDAHYRSHRIFILPQEAYTAGRLIGGAKIEGGTFAVAVLNGQYVLSIGAEDYAGAEFGDDHGWYGDDGFTTRVDQVRVITVDGADVAGIEVRLPADFLELPFVGGSWAEISGLDPPTEWVVGWRDVFSGVHPVSGH